jgi:hypothetical protein
LGTVPISSDSATPTMAMSRWFQALVAMLLYLLRSPLGLKKSA